MAEGGGTNLGTAYGYIEIRDNVDAAARRAAGALDNATKTMGKKMEDFGKKVSNVGLNIGLLVAPIVGFGAMSVLASITFESAFANVRKTVDDTKENLDQLRDRLRDLATSESPVASLPDALMMLTEISAMAGSLGVPSAEIGNFAEKIALLTTASDDVDAEQAAAFAGQFQNITGMDFSNLGGMVDTIVTLGNNMATTEGQIIDFGRRLAPLANFNWAEEDILAYSAALASLGVSPELGGTNVQKTVMDMTVAVAEGGPSMEAWAAAAGMAADEFAALAQADSQGAFNAFLEGLNEMDGTTQLQTLQELGITANEQITTIQRLAGEGYGVLNEALGIAEEAWQGNNAAFDEAAKKADTTEGAINRLNNQFTDLKIATGDALTGNLKRVAEDLTPVLNGITEWVENNPDLVLAIATVTLAVAAFAAILVVLGAVISAGGVVLGGLAAMAGAVGLVGLPVWALIAAIVLLVSTAQRLLPQIVESWREAFRQIGIFIDTVIGKLDALLAKLGAAYAAFIESIFDPYAKSRRGGMDTAEFQAGYQEHFGDTRVPGQQMPVPGYAIGGYTGDGPANAIAGFVHGQEWVVPKRGALVMGGQRKFAETVNIYANDRMGGMAAADAFEAEMMFEMRAMGRN